MGDETGWLGRSPAQSARWATNGAVESEVGYVAAEARRTALDLLERARGSGALDEVTTLAEMVDLLDDVPDVGVE